MGLRPVVTFCFEFLGILNVHRIGEKLGLFLYIREILYSMSCHSCKRKLKAE